MSYSSKPRCVGRHRERLDGFAGRKTLELGNPDLDHEAPTRFQMCGDVAETRNLFILCGQIHDRVAYEVGEGERPVDCRGREVADRHRRCRPHPASLAAARPWRAKARSHGRGYRAGSAGAQSTGADAKFEAATGSRQIGEEAHRRVDDRRLEHAPPSSVVASPRSVRRSSSRARAVTMTAVAWRGPPRIDDRLRLTVASTCQVAQSARQSRTSGWLSPVGLRRSAAACRLHLALMLAPLGNCALAGPAYRRQRQHVLPTSPRRRRCLAPTPGVRRRRDSPSTTVNSARLRMRSGNWRSRSTGPYTPALPSTLMRNVVDVWSKRSAEFAAEINSPAVGISAGALERGAVLGRGPGADVLPHHLQTTRTTGRPVGFLPCTRSSARKAHTSRSVRPTPPGRNESSRNAIRVLHSASSNSSTWATPSTNPATRESGVAASGCGWPRPRWCRGPSASGGSRRCATARTGRRSCAWNAWPELPVSWIHRDSSRLARSTTMRMDGTASTCVARRAAFHPVALTMDAPPEVPARAAVEQPLDRARCPTCRRSALVSVSVCRSPQRQSGRSSPSRSVSSADRVGHRGRGSMSSRRLDRRRWCGRPTTATRASSSSAPHHLQPPVAAVRLVVRRAARRTCAASRCRQIAL